VHGGVRAEVGCLSFHQVRLIVPIVTNYQVTLFRGRGADQTASRCGSEGQRLACSIFSLPSNFEHVEYVFAV
jgi:hypothetical protein